MSLPDTSTRMLCVASSATRRLGGMSGSRSSQWHRRSQRRCLVETCTPGAEIGGCCHQCSQLVRDRAQSQSRLGLRMERRDATGSNRRLGTGICGDAAGLRHLPETRSALSRGQRGWYFRVKVRRQRDRYSQGRSRPHLSVPGCYNPPIVMPS